MTISMRIQSHARKRLESKPGLTTSELTLWLVAVLPRDQGDPELQEGTISAALSASGDFQFTKGRWFLNSRPNQRSSSRPEEEDQTVRMAWIQNLKHAWGREFLSGIEQDATTKKFTNRNNTHSEPLQLEPGVLKRALKSGEIRLETVLLWSRVRYKGKLNELPSVTDEMVAEADKETVKGYLKDTVSQENFEKAYEHALKSVRGKVPQAAPSDPVAQAILTVLSATRIFAPR